MRSTSLVHAAIAAASAFAAASPVAAWAPRAVMAASHAAPTDHQVFPGRVRSSSPVTNARAISVSGVIVANGAAAEPKVSATMS